MFTLEELRVFADLLQNNFTTTALPAERQQELLLRGILVYLEEEALYPEAELQDKALELLYHSAARHPIVGVRGQAFQSLVRLAQVGLQPAMDTIYRLAVEEDLPAARQQIIAQGWQPSRPALRALFDWFSNLETGAPFPEESISRLTQAYFEEASPDLQAHLLATAPQNHMNNWARIISAVQSGTEQSLLELVERFPSFRPAERTITLEQLDHLAGSTEKTIVQNNARSALSLLFIRHEDPFARQLILSRGFFPEEAGQRALFFFLAEAWPQYEALDFDHHLLISAYEGAGRSLRRRLLEHSRHTGQIDWLRGISGSAEVRWLEDLADADWDLTIRRLLEGEKNADLWRLAQLAPPVWSAAILDRLVKRGWQPAGAEDRVGFTQLADLASESLTSPLSIRSPETLPVPPLSEITFLAMHPSGRTLAAGRNDQYILQWNLPEGDLLPTPLIGPAPVTRALAFSADGELLASASGDNRIRAFRLNNAQMLKTFEGHQAMIRALSIHPDGRTLYSAGFDGSIRFWRFPHGAGLKTLRPGPGEIFSLAISATGSHLLSAGTDGLVRVWTLPEGNAAREMAGHTDTITHLAASPTSELVASAGRDGIIRLWNFTSGGLVRMIENSIGPLTTLCMHPNDQVLIGGHSKGAITLWSLSTGRVIAQPAGHRLPVTGLVLSPNGDTLYSADSGGSIYVWDLRTLLAIRLPGQAAHPGAIARLQERVKDPSLSSSEKKWLNFSTELARWRQRFDIELEECTTIQVGEFDIEL